MAGGGALALHTESPGESEGMRPPLLSQKILEIVGTQRPTQYPNSSEHLWHSWGILRRHVPHPALALVPSTTPHPQQGTRKSETAPRKAWERH